MPTFLFDLDGTLADPYEGIANCMIHTLEHFGIAAPSPATLQGYIGPPIFDNFIHAGIAPERCMEALEIFDSRFLPLGMFENTIYEGIAQMLGKLKRKNHILAIASSKAQEFVAKIAGHFGIDIYFDYIGGSNLDGTRSDKAEVIEQVLQKLGVGHRQDVYLIGDRYFDIAGAKKTGIKSIAVLYGYGSREELESGVPDYMVETVGDLSQLLLSL